MIWHTKTVAF